MKRFLAIVQIAVVAFASFFTGSHCSAQDTHVGGYTKVTQVPRDKIDAWLKSEVKQSNGDWDKGRYSFYIGFSTSGFAEDPVPAIAMRRLAFTLMNNSLAVGDKLTPVAFEMNVSKVGSTIPLTADSDSRAQFVDEVPYTSTSMSRGGHDIERALYDTLQKIPPSESRSTIILLLNKDNSSQDPPGTRIPLFGEDNPQLKKAIKDGGFRSKLVRVDFPMKSGAEPISVYITALFPDKLESLQGTFGDRYPTFARNTWQPPDDAPQSTEKLPNQVAPDRVNPPPPPHLEKHGGIPWWVWPLLAIIVVGVILFMVMGKRSGVQRPLQPVAATVAAPKVETIPGSLRITIGPDEQTISPLVKGGTWTFSRQSDGVVKLIDTSKPAAGAATPASAGATAPGHASAVPVPVPDPGSLRPPEAPGMQGVGGAVPGTSLAKLRFGDDRMLHADADSGAQFAEMQGTAADRCDSRSLLIEPGKRILCRVLPPDAASKTRIEIVYDTQAGKGSKV